MPRIVRFLLPLAAVAAAATFLWFRENPEQPPQPTETPMAYRLDIEKLRGGLLLSGHAANTEHLAELRALAGSKSNVVRVDVTAIDGAPAHWESTTLGALRVVLASESGRAAVSADKIVVQIAGLAAPESTAQLAALSAGLPHDVKLVNQSIQVHPHDSQELCRHASAQFSHGPINFLESTDEFRPSAYPVMQRIAALAHACNTLAIEIVGHTDSSGNEPTNRLLSVTRAEAVADWLRNAGVSVARMTVRGEGSSQPLVSNRTRYGRSLNRRIDVRFVAD